MNPATEPTCAGCGGHKKLFLTGLCKSCYERRRVGKRCAECGALISAQAQFCNPCRGRRQRGQVHGTRILPVVAAAAALPALPAKPEPRIAAKPPCVACGLRPGTVGATGMCMSCQRDAGKRGRLKESISIKHEGVATPRPRCQSCGKEMSRNATVSKLCRECRPQASVLPRARDLGLEAPRMARRQGRPEERAVAPLAVAGVGRCELHQVAPTPFLSVQPQDGAEWADAGTLYRCPEPGCAWAAWRGAAGWEPLVVEGIAA